MELEMSHATMISIPSETAFVVPFPNCGFAKAMIKKVKALRKKKNRQNDLIDDTGCVKNGMSRLSAKRSSTVFFQRIKNKYPERNSGIESSPHSAASHSKRKAST